MARPLQGWMRLLIAAFILAGFGCGGPGSSPADSAGAEVGDAVVDGEAPDGVTGPDISVEEDLGVLPEDKFSPPDVAADVGGQWFTR